MKRTEEILQALRQARQELVEGFGVRRLAIFGSYARGDQREDSDVDVLVDVAPSIGLRFVDLAERVEAIVGVRSDVVSRRATKPRNWSVIEADLIDVFWATSSGWLLAAEISIGREWSNSGRPFLPVKVRYDPELDCVV